MVCFGGEAELSGAAIHYKAHFFLDFGLRLAESFYRSLCSLFLLSTNCFIRSKFWSTVFDETCVLSFCTQNQVFSDHLTTISAANFRRNMRYSCVRSEAAQIHRCFCSSIPWVLSVRVGSVLQTKSTCERQKHRNTSWSKQTHLQHRMVLSDQWQSLAHFYIMMSTFFVVVVDEGFYLLGW